MNGDSILFPQVIVCIAGKESKVRLINAVRSKIAIKAYPDCIEPLHMFMDGRDLVLTVLGKSYHPDRADLVFTVHGGVSKQERVVPVRVFTDREFFLVFCLQANYHIGWDPSWLPQYYPDMIGNLPSEQARVQEEKVGPDVFGSSYKLLFDNSDAKKYGIEFTALEKIYHDHGIPISWLIDQHVARGMANKIIDWHDEFGDTYSVLPTSRFYDNSINYNTERTAEDAKLLLQGTLIEVLEAFKFHDFPMYPNTCGFDQWVGSIGTNFVRAALELGFKGIWGMGWDHLNRNSSMFHRGAPWNAYKPSKYQFRIPARENEKFELFLFQWTARDLVNTLHLTPHGSAIFSTDPDDLRLNGIIKQTSPNYILELLYNYSKNMKYNDYFVFLIHQEDHDAHYKENNVFFLEFIELLVEEKPPGITLATMDEVAQWLSIKYPDSDVPSQILELDDPLTPQMREEIIKIRLQAIKQVYDPEDDAELERIMSEHFPTRRKLPVHVAFFNRDMLFLGYKPYHLPIQLWNYSNQEDWYVPEDGQFPLSIIPKINLLEEDSSSGYTLRLISDKFYSNLPWIVWNPPFKLKNGVDSGVAIQTENVVIFLINVQAGENIFDFTHLVS
ncbi:MAG: hypothetical protein ACTSUE_19885 [Promethearchaeota archaeon]